MNTENPVLELIAQIYAERKKRIDSGLKPRYLVINKETYQALQFFKANLGDLPTEESDYITKDRLFDLEICLENRENFKIFFKDALLSV
jgi:hypothetical protein